MSRPHKGPENPRGVLEVLLRINHRDIELLLQLPCAKIPCELAADEEAARLGTRHCRNSTEGAGNAHALVKHVAPIWLRRRFKALDSAPEVRRHRITTLVVVVLGAIGRGVPRESQQ